MKEKKKFFKFHFIINNLFFRNSIYFLIKNAEIELNNNKRCWVEWHVALNGGNANCDGCKDLFENKSNVRGSNENFWS